MANTHFQFKQFRIEQAQSGMKVTTDGCLFGAWVAEQFQRQSGVRILDIGTGTGLLALMIAQKSTAAIEAVEIDELAYKESRDNFMHSIWSQRIETHHLQIQDFQPPYSFDRIICNPPFFHKNTKSKHDGKNLAIHNESLGMHDLIQAVSRLLTSGGKFYLLYPEREMQSFTQFSARAGLYLQESVKVYNRKGENPFRIMGSFGKTAMPQIDSQVIIRHEDDYSADFIHLLKDYYLYL